jgi:hypothetical protein
VCCLCAQGRVLSSFCDALQVGLRSLGVVLGRTIEIDDSQGFRLSWGGVVRHVFKHRAPGAIFLDNLEVVLACVLSCAHWARDWRHHVCWHGAVCLRAWVCIM